MSGGTAIRVENLSKKFLIGHQVEGDLRGSFSRRLGRLMGGSAGRSREEFWALKNISFDIKQGEAVGIIGRNGAGKSTLLKILSRITYPTAGRFEINGRVSSLLEVGTGFHQELTGRENIYLNGTILGMRRAEIKNKFDAIVDFSGVEKFLDTPVKHYSSGMKVRLAFSVAAHLEPEILIIDEVLAVGDAEFQKKCLGKMDEVSKGEGRTVLFVSHNMGAVELLCERGIVLGQGEVDYIGDARDSIKCYFKNQHDHASEQQPFSVDLSTHPAKERSPLYELLTATTCVNGVKTNIISPGDKLEIDLTYRLHKTINCIVLGVVIKDPYGQAIIGVNNKHTAQVIAPKNSHGKVKFTLEDFAAYGNGQYWVDLYLGDGHDKNEIINDALCLELIASDVYHTGVFVNVALNRIYQPNVSFRSIE